MGNGQPPPEAATPAATPEPAAQPTPAARPTPQPQQPAQPRMGAPAPQPQLKGYDNADNEYGQRQRDQEAWVKTLGNIRQLPPEQQKVELTKLGMTPGGFSAAYEEEKAQLKAQQSAAGAESEAAGKTATEAETGADIAQGTADTAGLAMLLLNSENPVTWPMLVGAVGRAWAINQISGMAGDYLGRVANYVFPNSPNVKLGAQLVGGIAGGVLGDSPFQVMEGATARTVVKEGLEPGPTDVQGYMQEAKDLHSKAPVGIKSATDDTKLISPKEKAGLAQDEEARLKAEAEKPAEPPEEAPPAPPGGEKPPAGGEGEPPEKPPKGEKPEEPEEAKEPTPELQQQLTRQRQMRLSQKLGLHDNEDAVNDFIKRDKSEPLTDDDKANLAIAQRQGGSNLYKLSKAYMQAMEQGDMQKLGDLNHLADHEYSKFLHLQGFDEDTLKTGKSAADQSINLARTAMKTPDLMRAISTIQLKGRPDRVTRLISDTLKGLDVHQAAVNAQMLNPQIVASKVLTDMVWLPYNATVDAIGRIPQQGLTDSVKLYLSAMHAYGGAFGDAMGYAWKSFKSGAPEYLKTLGPKAATENTFGDDFTEGTVPGKAASFLSSVYASGSRAVMAADQFAKTLAGRMEMRTASLMRGLQDADEVGMTGGARWRYAETQAENYVNQNPDWLVHATLQKTARDTFTNDRPAVKALQNLVAKIRIPESTFLPEIPIGKLGALFLRTPYNLLDAGIYNSGFSFASPQFWGNIRAGGAARDQALAHWAVGAAMSYGVWKAANSGIVTGAGPTNKTTLAAMKAQGWQPYSIRIGNKYYSYAHLGPVREMIGLPATTAERYHEMKTPDSASKLALASVTSLATTVHNAPMMYTFGSFLNGVTELAQHGQVGDAEKFLSEIATTLIPHPVEAAAKVMHPEMTDPKGIVDNLSEESPFNRAGVPTKHDMFGYPMYVPPGYEHGDVPPNKWMSVLSAVNPIQTSEAKPDIVDHEIVRTGANIPQWPELFTGRPPSQSLFSDPDTAKVSLPFSTDPVKNEKMRARLAEIAGHELKIRGMNMHDFMEDRINSDIYQHPPGMTPVGAKISQQQQLEGIHKMFTEYGKIELMKEFPELKSDLVKRAGEHRALMFGPTGGTGNAAPGMGSATTAKLGAP